MKKIAFVITTTLFLTACATTQETTQHDIAAPQVFNGINITGDLYSHWIHSNINGKNKVSRNLVVKFDNETVINDYLIKNDATGELQGNWQGKKVDVICSSMRQKYNLKVDCMVLVDNSRTVTLTF